MAQHFSSDSQARYSNVAIILHWSIAALIVANIVLGWVMTAPERGMAPAPFAWHQSIGVTILLLSLVRLGWRLTHPWLPMPLVMLDWEKLLARTVHVLFYVAIIGIPLLGYMAMSARGHGPTFFGLFNLPALPLGENREQAELYGTWHVIAVYATVALLVLHVLGALKHTYIQRGNVLGRMIPPLLDKYPEYPAPIGPTREPLPVRRQEDA